MKKSEFLTKIMLGLIAVLALVAIILQIINKETTPLETTYEIITFSVALVAVILAVLQGLSNARVTRELKKITREIKENLVEVDKVAKNSEKLSRQITEIDRDNENLAKTLERDTKLDQEVLAKLDEKVEK